MFALPERRWYRNPPSFFTMTTYKLTEHCRHHFKHYYDGEEIGDKKFNK